MLGNYTEMARRPNDFSAKTRAAMAHRAGHRCSNPACRRATSKAKPGDPEGYIDLGFASHIVAASSGGPRSDEATEQAALRSCANGLWLCGRCAKEIDSAAADYPVELLQRWKRDAELVTARNASVTPDGIAQLVEQVQASQETIREHVGAYYLSTAKALARSRTEGWEAGTEDLLKASSSLMNGYNSNVKPLVIASLNACAAALSDDHPAIVAGREAEARAWPTTFGMEDLYSELLGVVDALLLR